MDYNLKIILSGCNMKKVKRNGDYPIKKYIALNRDLFLGQHSVRTTILI